MRWSPDHTHHQIFQLMLVRIFMVATQANIGENLQKLINWIWKWNGTVARHLKKNIFLSKHHAVCFYHSVLPWNSQEDHWEEGYGFTSQLVCFIGALVQDSILPFANYFFLSATRSAVVPSRNEKIKTNHSFTFALVVIWFPSSQHPQTSMVSLHLLDRHALTK